MGLDQPIWWGSQLCNNNNSSCLWLPRSHRSNRVKLFLVWYWADTPGFDVSYFAHSLLLCLVSRQWGRPYICALFFLPPCVSALRSFCCNVCVQIHCVRVSYVPYLLGIHNPPAIARDAILAVRHPFFVGQSAIVTVTADRWYLSCLVRWLFFHCFSLGVSMPDSMPDSTLDGSQSCSSFVLRYCAFRMVQTELQTATALVGEHDLVSRGYPRPC